MTLRVCASESHHGESNGSNGHTTTSAESLFEVLPSLLAGRRFPRFKGTEMIAEGYREAPRVHKGVAIAFAKATLPKDVDPTDSTIAAAMKQWEAICRNTLPLHHGYECKSPDPGKFTLSFHTFADAIAFAADVQRAVRDVQWSDELKKMINQDFFPVSVGIAYGFDLSKKPLSTYIAYTENHKLLQLSSLQVD